MANYIKKGTRKKFDEEQALRFLQEFKNVVSLGFYDETWSQASSIIRDMASVSTPMVTSAMGDILADQYVFPNLEKLDASIENIRLLILNK